MTSTSRRLPVALLAVALFVPSAEAQQPGAKPHDYRVLATTRTGTMEKEMNKTAEAGYRFRLVMGGETAAGNEVVVVMERSDEPGSRYQYRLLATSRTSTMQRELQEASEAGYDFVGQTVFKSTFGGDEVTCILERAAEDRPRPRYTYRLLATTRTSTMQKELQAAATDGFEVVALTIGKTAVGGDELVTIVRRPIQ